MHCIDIQGDLPAPSIAQKSVHETKHAQLPGCDEQRMIGRYPEPSFCNGVPYQGCVKGPMLDGQGGQAAAEGPWDSMATGGEAAKEQFCDLLGVVYSGCMMVDCGKQSCASNMFNN